MKKDVIAIGPAILLALPARAEDASGQVTVRGTAAKRPVKVFIVAGQSNARGCNRAREYKQGRVEFPKACRHQPDVLFWSTERETRYERSLAYEHIDVRIKPESANRRPDGVELPRQKSPGPERARCTAGSLDQNTTQL